MIFVIIADDAASRQHNYAPSGTQTLAPFTSQLVAGNLSRSMISTKGPTNRLAFMMSPQAERTLIAAADFEKTFPFIITCLLSLSNWTKHFLIHMPKPAEVKLLPPPVPEEKQLLKQHQFHGLPVVNARLL